MIYIGCDPGLTGAIASLSEDGKMITISDYKLDKDNRIDPNGLYNIVAAIRDYHNSKSLVCYLEKSQSMTGQGVTSSFNYGVTYGTTYSVLSCLGIEVIEITPQKWKKEFDLNSSKKLGIEKKKEDSVYKAIELFPSRESFLLETGKRGGKLYKHGRSDALLIAEYGRRAWNGILENKK